jgi:hypothetical protein
MPYVMRHKKCTNRKCVSGHEFGFYHEHPNYLKCPLCKVCGGKGYLEHEVYISDSQLEKEKKKAEENQRELHGWEENYDG